VRRPAFRSLPHSHHGSIRPRNPWHPTRTGAGASRPPPQLLVSPRLVNFGGANLLAVCADHPAGIQDLPWVCGGGLDEAWIRGRQPTAGYFPAGSPGDHRPGACRTVWRSRLAGRGNGPRTKRSKRRKSDMMGEAGAQGPKGRRNKGFREWIRALTKKSACFQAECGRRSRSEHPPPRPRTRTSVSGRAGKTERRSRCSPRRAT
jgi:hypothetical protein